MKCEHRAVTAHTKLCRGSFRMIVGVAGSNGERLLRETSECATCGTWLPLGPSDEAPVAVEVRAAELALSPHDWSPEEIAGGYVAANWYLGAPFCDALVTPGEEAGYLAELIIDHDHDQMAEAREQAESALREAASEFLGGMGEAV